MSSTAVADPAFAMAYSPSGTEFVLDGTSFQPCAEVPFAVKMRSFVPSEVEPHFASRARLGLPAEAIVYVPSSRASISHLWAAVPFLEYCWTLAPEEKSALFSACASPVPQQTIS